jgi:hypothetical protein
MDERATGSGQSPAPDTTLETAQAASAEAKVRPASKRLKFMSSSKKVGDAGDTAQAQGRGETSANFLISETSAQ